MKTRLQRPFYVVEAGEAYLKAAKCVESSAGKEFVAFRAIPWSGTGPETAEERIIGLLRELGYRKGPVVFSLPRNLATLRYLKVPARDPREIERMVAFQAPRHIPYPAEELVTAYELVCTDSEGLAHLNLVIVHQDTVAAYLKVCRSLKIAHPVVVLSSFGLCRSFRVLRPEENAPVIILDIDDKNVELAVAYRGSLSFSRSLKTDGSRFDPRNGNPNGWQTRLAEELSGTLELYSKEVSPERPARIFILGREDLSRAVYEFLVAHTSFHVEELHPDGRIRVAEAAKRELERPVSFYSLIGFGLAFPADTLSLLPSGLKGRLRSRRAHVESLKLSLTFAAALFFVVAGMALNVRNKSWYLERLQGELRRIHTEVAPLEEIDRRVALLKKSHGKSAGLDVLYDVHQTLPDDISFNAFEFDPGGKVVLRGQTRQLEGVFALARKLEAADAFRGYSVTVNYATRRKTGHGESVVFEIVASRRG